jgi:nitrogenase molybdenum-iron protein alpha/beta subunit
VGTAPQWRGNAEELARLLTKAGFTVHIVPFKSAVWDVEKMSAANYTILVNPQIGKAAAELLHERFNIPALIPQNLPLGLVGTEGWLREICAATDMVSSIIDKIIDQEKDDYYATIKSSLREDNYNLRVNIIRNSKFLICDEYERAMQWSKVLLKELTFTGGYLFPTIKPHQVDPAKHEQLEVINELARLKECCEDKEVALVFASDWLNEFLERKLPKLVIITNPVIKKITLVSKPYYGFRGAIHFLEDCLNQLDY